MCAGSANGPATTLVTKQSVSVVHADPELVGSPGDTLRGMTAGRWTDFQRLVHAAGSGDTDALGELWRRYQPMVVRFARARGERDAADVASEVWLDVARSLPRFVGDDTDFRKWILTIARRRVIDHHRRHRRLVPSDRIEQLDTTVEDQDRSDLEAIIAMVRRLPRVQAEAILLRYLADLSDGDVAEVLGTSSGNVRVLIHRGLARLQQMLDRRERPS